MTPALLHSLRQILGPMTSERKCEEVVRVVLEGMRDLSPVVRVGGYDPGPVHQLVGAPEDLWRTLLDAALSELSQPAES